MAPVPGFMEWTSNGVFLTALVLESSNTHPSHATPDGRRLVATVANPDAGLWRVPISDQLVDGIRGADASRFRQREGFLPGSVRVICCTFPRRAGTTESGSLLTQLPLSCGAAHLAESWRVRPFHRMASASPSPLRRADETGSMS